MTNSDLDDMVGGVSLPSEDTSRKVTSARTTMPIEERSLRYKAQELVRGKPEPKRNKITSLNFSVDFHKELKMFAIMQETSMVAVIEEAVRRYMAEVKANPDSK
ncbi:Rho GTPase-activating protein [Brucella thiophenivorans]|uniref:hypothetical protein n=1 Tax=Brucella thiophenivorans TaxID=571255 RepID=UPI000B99ABEC|nr:hypothetical protein [Brucella thiophenivorans]